VSPRKGPAALVSLGVGAALVVTGSATAEQARSWGMTGVVPIALVVLLEVVNVVGTWVWMTDPRAHVQVEAASGVAVASIYSGICAVLSYGIGGAIAPAGVLFTVHLAGRLVRRPAAPPEAAAHPAPVPAHRHAATPAPSAPPPPPSAPAPSEPPTAPMRRPTLAPWEAPVIDLDALPRPEEVEDEPAPEVEDEVEDEPAPPRPASDKGQLDDEDILAALAQVPDLPSRDALKAAYRVGTRRADRLLAQARANRRPRLVAAPEENR
jgi:hypothetical protein